MSLVSERFKAVRKKFGYNQKDFASELGISQTHVSGIENGKDNPSSSLLKLIGIKFNVNEKWLADGTGSPEIGWDIDTDEGAIEKYNAMRVSFEQRLRTRKGEDLVNTVEAFSHFVSLMSMADGRLNNDEDAKKYREYIYMVIDNLERLTFKTTVRDTVPSKNNAKGRILYKNECNEYAEAITKNIKQAINLYLVGYGDEMKL